MSNRARDDFIEKSNEAAREALRDELTSEDLETCDMKTAAREFYKSESLQDDYETFALFAQDIEFETEEEMQRAQDEFDKHD